MYRTFLYNLKLLQSKPNQLTLTGLGRTLYLGSSNLCSPNMLIDSLLKLKVFEFTTAAKNKKQNKSFILVYLI